MKKRVLAGICLLLMLVLPACAPSDSPQAEVSSMDRARGAELVDESEWLCAWLSQQREISREQARAFASRMDALLPGEGENALTAAMADATDWEDPAAQSFSLGNGTVRPTLYHQGVELVACTLEILPETDSPQPNREQLTVRLEYRGADPSFQDWFLEYHYLRGGPEEEWAFSSYSGTYNAEGSLPLKDGFDAARYPAPEGPA